jgi:Kef-type K+ transport system membrane component KefB
MLAQVAIADAVCIVALPLAVDPRHAARAAFGALAVLAAAAAAFVILQYLERSGIRRRVHRVSEERKFALELRTNLVILFALAALATRTHVSIMLAGFSFGLAVAAVGQPRRLARQLFAVTEGFFGPLFFIWLGVSLDLRELGRHPSMIGLGLALGAGAVATHTAMRLTGQPTAIAALTSAQLGVPVAAANIGSQLGLLKPGESAALLLGALVTIAVAVLCGGVAARAGLMDKDAQPAATTGGSAAVARLDVVGGDAADRVPGVPAGGSTSGWSAGPWRVPHWWAAHTARPGRLRRWCCAPGRP